MAGRLPPMVVAGLLLAVLGLGAAGSQAVPPSPGSLSSGEGSTVSPGSLVEAARFVPGRQIPPVAFMTAVFVVGLLLQAVRPMRGKTLPLVRGVTTLLIFLVVWELAVYLGLITTILLPPPTIVLQRLDALWLNDYLHWHVLATVRRFVESFGLAVATGFPLGVLVASFPRVFAWFHPVITFVRMIPSPAWAPIAILWLGLGDPPAIFVVWIAVFFPIFVNTIRGIHDTQPICREVIRTLGGARWDEILHATVPSALPAVLTGVRVGFGFGWVVLASAELIAVDSGLGWLIQVAYTQVDSPAVLAAMTLICWMGVLLDSGLRQLERRLIPW